MADTLVPMTKLEAVNIMLDIIGEAPVSTLAEDTVTDAAKAELLLDQTSRELQTGQWNFNTENEYKLLPDSNKNIKYPLTAIEIDGYGKDQRLNLVRRDNKVYNETDKTFEFDRPILTTIKWLFPFDDLPEVVRQYITTRAGRIFQDRNMGSDTIHKFTMQDEQTAWIALRKFDSRKSDANMMYDSHSVYMKLPRRVRNPLSIR